MSDQAQTPYKTFVEKGIKYFQTSGGVKLDLGDGIPPLMYRTFLASQAQTKPGVPKKVTQMGTRQYLLDLPNDPDYKTEQGYWAIMLADNMIKFVLSYVRTQPPPDFVPELFDESATLTPKQLKVLWIMGLLKTDEEVDAITDAIMGITMPDEKEIATLQETTFPPDVQRGDGDSGV